MQQQLQLLRQQASSSVPAPPVVQGAPGLESYRISAPSPVRSPPPPPPRDPQDVERDVFAKSDKWLPSLPTIDFTSWKDRTSEALGFLTWMEKLTSWVGLGSEVFPNELRHAIRTKDEEILGQDRLTVEQQKRSIRLLHILRQTFANHDKSSLILQNYVEGAVSYQQSGFVALRLLAKEFCLKSRSECLYFRAQLTNQTVKAPTIPEIVRKIESEQHKYSKLLNSLDSDVRAQGLELQEADLVMVLLRSLPEKCRSYCLLHGDSDSFEDLKRIALKYEVQQRVWSEGSGSKLNPVQTDTKGKGGDEKGNPKGKGKKGQKVGARVYPRVGLRATRRTWYALIARRRGTMPVSAGLLRKRMGRRRQARKVLVNRLQKPRLSRKVVPRAKVKEKAKQLLKCLLVRVKVLTSLEIKSGQSLRLSLM